MISIGKGLEKERHCATAWFDGKADLPFCLPLLTHLALRSSITLGLR
jgi:hypothetical protein